MAVDNLWPGVRRQSLSQGVRRGLWALSHCRCFPLMERPNVLVCISQTTEKEKTFLDHDPLETASSWSCNRLIFLAVFSWMVWSFRIHNCFFHLKVCLALDSFPNSRPLNLQPYSLSYWVTFVSKQFFRHKNAVLTHLWSFAIFAKSSSVASRSYLHCISPNTPD